MSELKKLKELFESKCFRIPDYQRGYSWEESQIIDLWNDLLNLTESNEKHFMSFISYKEIKDEKEINNILQTEATYMGSDSLAILTDGQQRITTIIILLNELLNYFDDNDDENKNIDILDDASNDEIRKTYLYIKKSENCYKYKFGYAVDDPSYKYFKKYILGKESMGTESNESLYTNRL